MPAFLTPPSALAHIVLPPSESFTLHYKEPETKTTPQIDEPSVLFPNKELSPLELSSLSCEFAELTPGKPPAKDTEQNILHKSI